MHSIIYFCLCIIFYNSITTYAEIGTEFSGFKTLNSIIKKSNYYYSKIQPISPDLYLDTTNVSLSKYEINILHQFLKYKIDSSANISINSEFNYNSFNDKYSYYISPFFIYNTKFFDFNMGYRLDSKFMDDSNYLEGIGYTKRSKRARMNLAKFMIKPNDKFSFGFERSNENWSYIGLTSPILSNNPYTYDKIKLKYITDHIQFEMITSLLDSNNNMSRRLYAKHINFIFKPGNFVISPGFMETMLEATKTNLLRVSSLYPFVPAFLNMMNREAGGNSIIGTDFLLKYSNLLNIYSQFIVDDWQIDNKKIVGNQEPNLWAMNLAFDIFLPKNVQFGSTYSRAQNWTYYVNYKTEESFTYYNKSLGFENNDFDYITAYILKDINKFRFKLNFSYKRLGWNTINNKIKSLYWVGYETKNFPMTNNEKNFAIEKIFESNLEIWFSYWSSLSLGYKAIRNKTNILNNNEDKIYINISTYPQLIYNFPKFLFR